MRSVAFRLLIIALMVVLSLGMAMAQDNNTTGAAPEEAVPEEVTTTEEVAATEEVAPTTEMVDIVEISVDDADEYIIINNSGAEAMTMDNFTIVIDDNVTIPMPAFTMESMSEIMVHFGAGTDTATDLFLNQTAPVLNDTMVIIAIMDAEGNEIASIAFEAVSEEEVVESTTEEEVAPEVSAAGNTS